jgi:hypothetical protein
MTAARRLEIEFAASSCRTEQDFLRAGCRKAYPVRRQGVARESGEMGEGQNRLTAAQDAGRVEFLVANDLQLGPGDHTQGVLPRRVIAFRSFSCAA